MSLQELREYITTNSAYDAKYIEKIGFGEIAKLVSDGAMNKALLLNLIDLSAKNAEKNERDEQAGRMIFDECCKDEKMKAKVDNFFKDR